MTENHKIPPQLFLCVDYSFFCYTNRLLVGCPEADRYVCGGEWAMKAKSLAASGYDLKKKCGIVETLDGENQLKPETFWTEIADKKGIKLEHDFTRSFMGEYLKASTRPLVTLSMVTQQEVDLIFFAGQESGLDTPRNGNVTQASWLGDGITSGRIKGWVRDVVIVFPNWLKKVTTIDRLLPTDAERSLWPKDHPPISAMWYDDWPGVYNRRAAGTFVARNPAVTPPWADHQFCDLVKGQPTGHSVVVGEIEFEDGETPTLPMPQLPRPYAYEDKAELCPPCLEKIQEVRPVVGLAPPDPDGVVIRNTAIERTEDA